MMALVGYDVITLGNHEFDYGFPQLMENLKKHQGDFMVACNNLVDDEGELIFAPGGTAPIYADDTYETELFRIAIVGMATPETQTKANPALIKGLKFDTDLKAVAEKQLEALKDELRIGVMEADIDSDVDAKTIADAGVKSIQLHTGGMCHLDASMTEQGLKEIGTKDLDLVVLENVGNLVCPAEFDTGAVKNAMILSVPEGHDKPLKYPLIFTVCDALIINKIDVLPYFDFDMEKVVEYAHMRNPKLKIFPLSAKTGEGVDAWCDWLREQVRAWNG